MRVDQILDRLLASGDASIQYQITKELLGVAPETDEMHELQAQILDHAALVRLSGWVPGT
jgi:hypothetical protein